MDQCTLPFSHLELASQNSTLPSSFPGILGPRPAHSFYTELSTLTDYFPTKIHQALHTLSMSSPDEQFYMDIDATSHMTLSQGTLINYFLLKHPNNNHIIIGNGNMIPVHGHGNLPISSSHPSLTLKHVLYAPRLIKNLISVRNFTIDNNVSMEFDPYG